MEEHTNDRCYYSMVSFQPVLRITDDLNYYRRWFIYAKEYTN